jgi:hypothetical protein
MPTIQGSTTKNKEDCLPHYGYYTHPTIVIDEDDSTQESFNKSDTTESTGDMISLSSPLTPNKGGSIIRNSLEQSLLLSNPLTSRKMTTKHAEMAAGQWSTRSGNQFLMGGDPIGPRSRRSCIHQESFNNKSGTTTESTATSKLPFISSPCTPKAGSSPINGRHIQSSSCNSSSTSMSLLSSSTPLSAIFVVERQPSKNHDDENNDVVCCWSNDDKDMLDGDCFLESPNVFRPVLPVLVDPWWRLSLLPPLLDTTESDDRDVVFHNTSSDEAPPVLFVSSSTSSSGSKKKQRNKKRGKKKEQETPNKLTGSLLLDSPIEHRQQSASCEAKKKKKKKGKKRTKKDAQKSNESPCTLPRLQTPDGVDDDDDKTSGHNDGIVRSGNKKKNKKKKNMNDGGSYSMRISPQKDPHQQVLDVEECCACAALISRLSSAAKSSIQLNTIDQHDGVGNERSLETLVKDLETALRISKQALAALRGTNKEEEAGAGERSSVVILVDSTTGSSSSMPNDDDDCKPATHEMPCHHLYPPPVVVIGVAADCPAAAAAAAAAVGVGKSLRPAQSLRTTKKWSSERLSSFSTTGGPRGRTAVDPEQTAALRRSRSVPFHGRIWTS